MGIISPPFVNLSLYAFGGGANMVTSSGYTNSCSLHVADSAFNNLEYIAFRL